MPSAAHRYKQAGRRKDKGLPPLRVDMQARAAYAMALGGGDIFEEVAEHIIAYLSEHTG